MSLVHEKERDSSPDVQSFADWKPSKAEWLMIVCFMIVSLVVALDATILVPILPVRYPAISESPANAKCYRQLLKH
jgi:hypothetical protein